MPVVAVTGGIASGKSSVARRLADNLRKVETIKSVESFSADQCGHDLLDEDPDVRAAVALEFGREIYSKAQINRQMLREIVFADPAKRSALESILHPKIRATWIGKIDSFRGNENYFVAEIPLLYETGCASYFDFVVVVEADPATQMERLSSKRGWSLETGRRVIDTQMPSAEKSQRADILILNNHTEKLLHRQVELATLCLVKRYA